MYRKLLDEAYLQEQLWGSKAAYFTNYFPHVWDRPSAFAAHMENVHGSTWFQKRRIFEMIEDGLAAGFKLKTTNPEALMRMRLMAGADMRHTMRMLADLYDINQAIPVKTQMIDPKRLMAAGWREVVAPNRDMWLISPDIQPLWDNAVKAKGLWAAEGLTGKAFRAWMGFKNVWVPIKLALSGFHALHIGGINTAHYWALAAEQFPRGRIIGGTANLLRGLSPVQPKGARARGAWLTDPSKRTPWQEQMVKLMHEGGFSPMMSEQLRIDASTKISDALQKSDPFLSKAIKAPIILPYHALRGFIQKIQSGLFEHWIPHLKTAAYLNQVEALLRRRPEYLNDSVKRGIALRAIAKSVDNRFGEMFYSNLFWNRTVKDLGIASFLSLGWNLGFFREFGGAAGEMAARPLGKVARPLRLAPKLSEERRIIRDATNKIKFANIYLAIGAASLAMISVMLGGRKPEDLTAMDVTFPYAGGENPDGSDRRYTSMWFNREFPMYMKHVQEHGGGALAYLKGFRDMMWSKMLFGPLIELYNNRNYWGDEIYNPEAPASEIMKQIGKHILTQQFAPMAVTGAKRSEETGGGRTGKIMSYLGFGPAPSYAAKTATENRIAHLYREYKAPPRRPYQDPDEREETRKARADFLAAKQSGDQNEIDRAADVAREAGVSQRWIKETLAGVTSTDRLFKQLFPEHQIMIVEQAPPREREHYGRIMTPKARALWEKQKGEPPAFADGGGVNADSRYPRAQLYAPQPPAKPPPYDPFAGGGAVDADSRRPIPGLGQ